MKITGTPTQDFVQKLQSQDVSIVLCQIAVVADTEIIKGRLFPESHCKSIKDVFKCYCLGLFS